VQARIATFLNVDGRALLLLPTSTCEWGWNGGAQQHTHSVCMRKIKCKCLNADKHSLGEAVGVGQQRAGQGEGSHHSRDGCLLRPRFAGAPPSCQRHCSACRERRSVVWVARHGKKSATSRNDFATFDIAMFPTFSSPSFCFVGWQWSLLCKNPGGDDTA
jgi:hypothetical protein